MDARGAPHPAIGSSSAVRTRSGTEVDAAPSPHPCSDTAARHNVLVSVVRAKHAVHCASL